MSDTLNNIDEITEDEEKKKEEKKQEELSNSETVVNANNLAQEEARRNAEEVPVEQPKEEPVVEFVEEAPAPVEQPKEEPAVEEDDQQEFDPESVFGDEDKPAEVAEEVVPAESNAAESAETAEEPNDISDEEFQGLVNAKFAEATQADREKLESSIEAIKKSHPKDYDAYVEKLKNTRYYKKSLEKWTKYYTELKNKCAEQVKEEIETTTEAEARMAAAEAASATPVAPFTPVQEVENAEIAPVVSNAEKANVVEPQPEVPSTPVELPLNQPTANPTVDELEMKYTPLAVDGVMPVDERLAKTVEQVLLESFYTSIDEVSDFYNNLNASKKTNELVSFRNQIANNLQQVQTKFVPGKSEIYMPYVRSMQKDIENHIGNMEGEYFAIAEQFFDKMYHIDLKTNETSGVIPSLASEFAAEIQDILVSNNIFDFNLSVDNVRNIMNRVVTESGIEEALGSRRRMKTGVVDIVGILNEHISRIKNNEVKYVEGMQEKFGAKFEEIKQANPVDTENYERLFNVVKMLEKAKKEIAETGTTYETNKIAKDRIKQAEARLKEIKAIGKLDESTDKKASDKIGVRSENEKRFSVSDFLTFKFIRMVSRAKEAGNMSTFAYTDKDVIEDVEIITSRLRSREQKEITADTLDTIGIIVEDIMVNNPKFYEDNKEKVDDYAHEVARFAGVMESEKDSAKQAENQKYAKILVADFRHLQEASENAKTRKSQAKKDLSKQVVKELELGFNK